ncbi:MAG: TonB family protein [Saprospiraceae bacterium]
MKKERRSDHFIPKPTFKGGQREMSAFIKENLKYPKDALAKKIKGTVRIKIEINYKGKVIGSQIMTGLNASCNAEAKRVVKLLEFEINHKLRKGKVRYHKTLNIKFSPPKPGKQKTYTTTINYKIISNKKKEVADPEKNKGENYNYTIDIS